MFASTLKPRSRSYVQQRVAIAGLAQQDEAGKHDGSPSQFLLGAREDLVKRHARHDSV